MWTVAMKNHGELFWLLIGLSSCVTVYHDPSTPTQGESLTLVCRTMTAFPGVPVRWYIRDSIEYSSNCSLNENEIRDNNDDPTNYEVVCDIRPGEFYQHNLTIHRLEKKRHERTWICTTFIEPNPLNVTVHVRADQPVWIPGARDYREGQLYNLTCSTNVADPVPVFSWWMTGSDGDSREMEGAAYDWENDTGIYNTIAFLPNRTLQGVDIWCRLNQSRFGERDSERHRVNVIYPPTQTSARSSHEDPIAVDVQTETVIVSCQVSEENHGNPPIYNYTWTLLRDGKIPGDDPTTQNLTLSVNRNNLCLDNEYTCRAANILGEAASDAVNVTLAVSPELELPIDTHYDVRYDNDSFVLDCRYNAKPEALVLWSDFNDEVFEAIDLANQPNGDCNLMVYSSQRLQWRNYTSLEQRKAGSGFVTCAADNGVGGEHTENVTINVQYPPVRSRGHPAEISVVASMTPRQVTLSCVVDDLDKGNPDDYVFNWTRQHGDIPQDYNTSGNLTFNLSRSSIFLDDVYTCYVKNTIGTGRPANVTLAVQAMPEYVGDGSYLATVLNTHDDISLSCQYVARPVANITWAGYRQDVFSITEQEEEGVAEGDDTRELLTRSQRNLTWTTTDVQLRKHGSANVTCSGNNGVGAPDDRIVEINVQYGPGAPTLSFTNDVVYAGETAAMTCSLEPGPDGTDGNPTVTEYTWLFGSEKHVDKNNSRVTFAVTSVTQEGGYTCYGTNHPVGGSIRGDTSQPANLTVNVYPYLVQPNEPPDDVTVLYNDDQNTSLSCLGAGKPEVYFNWYHNGRQVDGEDFIEEKDIEAGKYLYDLHYGWRSYLMRAVGGAYFTCENITKYDGHYQCEAYNDEQMSNKSSPVRLITHYPAHWAGPVLHPKLYTSPGDNFTLLCDVCMEPRGNITWYLNGEPVRDIISITDDGRNLTLTDVQLKDFGNYTCQVTNIILDENYAESFDISLVKRGAPHKPLAFQVDGFTSRSLNVSWLPGSTGGYDSQTFTLCYVTHDVHPSCQIKDQDDGDLIKESLRDLEVNTTYQLRLYAENAHHGNNRSSLTAMNHSTKVAPVIKVVDLTLSPTHVTVTWVVEAGEPSHLTLVHCPAEDCNVSTQRSRRNVKATWRELATHIPPDVGTLTYEVKDEESFDELSHNRFSLWAYEPGLEGRSNTDDDNTIRDVPPRSSDGVDIGLVVGIVLAVVAAAALATGGFVYYRKKAAKDSNDPSSKRANYSDNIKGFGVDQVQYEDIDEGSRDHSVSSASSAPKEYGTYEDVTRMSIMATCRQHRAEPDETVCIDVPMKLPFDEVDEDASYMGLHHHDNKDNDAYEELQVIEIIA